MIINTPPCEVWCLPGPRFVDCAREWSLVIVRMRVNTLHGSIRCEGRARVYNLLCESIFRGNTRFVILAPRHPACEQYRVPNAENPNAEARTARRRPASAAWSVALTADRTPDPRTTVYLGHSAKASSCCTKYETLRLDSM